MADTLNNTLAGNEVTSKPIAAPPVENKVDSSLSVLDRAEAAAKRIEDANKVQLELLERQEHIQAQRMLAGVAEAGNSSRPEPELTPQEYAKLVMEGKANPLTFSDSHYMVRK